MLDEDAGVSIQAIFLLLILGLAHLDDGLAGSFLIEGRKGVGSLDALDLHASSKNRK